MSEINSKILELIEKNYSANEISEVLNITNKQLFYRLTQLKNKGYNICKKYYANGEIEYFLNKSFYDKDTFNKKSIFISKKYKFLKTIVISDLHLSSIYENIDALDKIYNYCAANSIHIIINTGDVNNCTSNLNNRKVYSTSNMKQIEHMLKVYPFDKNILNYILFGNHDYDILVEDGIDIKKILEDKRHDLIPLDYGMDIINMGKDKITLKHNLKKNFKMPMQEKGIILMGHFHNYKVIDNNVDKHIIVQVPTLSTLNFEDKNDLPNCALEITFNFDDSYLIENVNIKHLYINDKIYVLGETRLKQLNFENYDNNECAIGSYKYKLTKQKNYY